MAGGEGDRLGGVAVGEGDVGAGGAGQGGGDAGDDFEGDIGGGKCFGFLAPAAEDEGVAALEADDFAAFLAEADQEGVDILLLHGVVGAGLADQDAVGVAPGHVEDLGRDEAIVHDDVGLAEQALSAKGEEVGGARAGADEIDDTGRVGARVDLPEEFGSGGLILAGQHEVGNTATQSALKDPAAERDVRQAGADGLFPALGESGEAAVSRGDQGLDARAEQAGENGRSAAGADGHENGGAVDDAGGDVGAQGRAVDDVDGDAASLGRGGEGGEVRVRRVGADGDGDAVEIGGRKAGRGADDSAPERCRASALRVAASPEPTTRA